MDGAGFQSELKDLSRPLGFAQRVVTSGFALNVLGREYDPKTSPKSQIGPAVFEALGSKWGRGENIGKKIGDAARYFEDWHRLRKVAASRTLQGLREYKPGLEYLKGLESPHLIGEDDVHGLSYIPLVGASLAALDSTRTEKKKSAADLRIDLATAILGTIAARWKPDRDGQIQLPRLAIGGLIRTEGQSPSKATQAHKLLWDFTLQVSGDAIRMYPVRNGIDCVDYLYALITDVNPMPMEALPRWALDMTSALLAVRCLQCAEAEHDCRQKPNGHSSNLAYEAACMEGVACWLLGPKQQDLSDTMLCSTIERIKGLLKGERVLRGLWGDWTMGFARRALDWIWPLLGTETDYFLRAYRRHTLAPHQITPTVEGIEVLEEITYLKRLALSSLPDIAMGVRDDVRRPNSPHSRQAECNTDDWVSVYRRITRELVQIRASLAERCNAEGRTPVRAEYECFLRKYEVRKRELQTKQVPETAQAILGDSRQEILKR